MSVSIRFVAAVVGAAALVLSAGCGQPPEDEPAAEPNAQAAKPAKSPASTGPVAPREAPRVVTMTELPANFPDDVPNHPEGQVLQARATSDMGLAVSMVVEDDVTTVAKYYAKAFSSEGWSTNVKNMPDGSAVFAEKGNRNAAVMVTEGRRGAQVELIVGQR